MERAVLLCRDGRVRPEDMPPALLSHRDRVAAGEAFAPPTAAMGLDDALAGPEKMIIQAALSRNEGSRQATAAELQINRTTLYKKMKKYGLLGA
jgi:two-component system response regulator HydG